MKKILCILLSAALLSSLFAAVGFAADGDILNRDFEDGSVSGINKSAAVSIVDGQTEDGGKCLFFGASGDIARFMFPKDTVVSGGTLCVEFDIKEGFGGIGMGVFTSADTNYGNYQKSPLSSGTRNSTPPRGLKAYIAPGAKQHPNGNAGSESYIKGYRAKGADKDLAIEANKWQHVLLELDLDNACSYLTLDGVKSEAVEGFTYLSDIVGIGFKWSPAGMAADASDSLKEAYIDNLRVYMAPPKVSGIKIIRNNGRANEDLTKVSPKTNAVEIAFSEKMISDSVSGAVLLYNVTEGKDVGISLAEFSADGKTFVFGIDDGFLSENTDYKITVGECEAESGLFTAEFELEFSSTDLIGAERISYYSNDFEDSEVGKTPKNVLGISDTAKDYATVKEEGANKYMVTASRSRFLLNQSITGGVIVLDTDIKIASGGSVGFGIVYGATPTTYAKWPLGINGSGKMIYYDAAGATPTGTLEGHTYNLVKKNSDEQMSFEADKWHNMKIYMDTDNCKITVELDGEISGETREIPFISGANGIGGMVFYTSNLKDISLDNFNVYRAEPGVLKAEITAADGNVLTGEKISSSAQSVKITFADKITSEPDIKLECNGADEPFKAEWDTLRRSVSITPEKGYFESESRYALTVAAGYTDSFDRVCDADYSFEFETDEGGLKIFGLYLEKDGKNADLSGINAGDTITVCAPYVLTRADKRIENAVLAVVFEKDGRLMHIAKKTVNLDKSGNSRAEFDVQIPTETEFDSAYVYLWDLNSRAPINYAK